MTDIKLFERWVKKSLKEHFIFKPYKGFFIVTNGYVGFKIANKCRSYRTVIKEQTFQDLKEDFKIYNRKIEKISSPDLENLLIFMCQTYEETEQVLLKLSKEGNEALFKVPRIQGIANTIPIAQIAKIKFEQPKHGFKNVKEEILRKRG